MSNNTPPSNLKSEDSPLGQVTSLDDLLSTLTDDFRRWFEPQLLAWHKAEVAKILQVIEDEAVRANRMSYQPNNWDNTKTWPIIRQPCLIIPEEIFKQLKDNVINGGSL